MTLAKIERPRAVIRQVRCMHNCGYVRPYTDATWWLDRVITHPLYGPVTGQKIVELDMWYHVCDKFLERRERARTIFKTPAHRR